MTEHEVRCAVDECLEEACATVIRGRDDTGIADALLEHREQRFRLSYPLGEWQQEKPGQGTDDDQYEMDYEYEDEEDESETLADDETVDDAEITGNNARLLEYVARIKNVTAAAREQVVKERGDFQDMDNANRRQDWLEDFTSTLYESHEFADISLDIMDAISERFDLITAGVFERSSTGWPTLWHYEEDDRDTFLKQARWFSSNHALQFGRLLTPLVDDIRVRGSFRPTSSQLWNDDLTLVLLDGEGLGHSAKEATRISTNTIPV